MPCPEASGRMEIVLRDGAQVIVSADIDAPALMRARR